MNERRKPYPFDRIEPKWQNDLGRDPRFPCAESRRREFRSGQAEILRARHVPLPERRGPARRPSGGLHRHRHRRALQAAARFQRSASDGLGCVRPARPSNTRSRPGSIPAITTRENMAKFKAQLKRIGFSYDWEREVNTTDPGLLQMDAVDFPQIYNSWFNPETKKAEPISTYRGEDPDGVRLAYVAEVAGELVSGTRHRAGERRSHRRQKRSGWFPGGPATDAPMDAAHHRVRRSAAG